MHNKIYYIHNGSEQKGPFSIEDLKQFSITKDTNIWYDGASDWKKASEIPELKDLLVVIPPKFIPPFRKKRKSSFNKKFYRQFPKK